jgi:hypothetical protein
MDMARKKIKEQPPIFAPVIDAADLDPRTVFMLGLPGHRTAMGRSGLGYLATQAELAYMQGLMIRWLFTGKFRTRNPIYLFVMFMLGLLIGIIPIGAVIFEIVRYSNFEMVFVPFIGFPYIAVGCALFVNSILSLLNWDGKTITGD